MTVFEVKRRNPEATRASILRAAEQLFVARGFAGTSMSDVARGAGVTKSLIHHHFGTKEELWQEVKRQRFAEYAELQLELIRRPEEQGAQVLLQSMETLYRFLERNPEFVRLSAWMSLEDPKLSESVYPDLITTGLQRIREDQRAGLIRDDVDPGHIIIMMISLCTYWFMARNARFSGLAEGGLADDEYLDSLRKVLLGGVLPAPRTADDE